MINEDYKNKLKEKLKNENITLLTNLDGDFKTTSKIAYECNKCKNRYITSIGNVMDVRRTSKICNYCAKKEKFEEIMITKYKRIPYEFLTDFKGYEEPITVKCKDCGFVFTEEKAKALLMNSKLKGTNHPCKQCTINRRKSKVDIKDLENELIKRFGACNYEFLEPEKYTGLYSKENFKFKCKKCGNVFSTLITNVLHPRNGTHYCAVCNNKEKSIKEDESYRDACLRITDKKLEPLEPYINNRTKIKHRCNVCGYEWLKLPISSMHGSGCPKCSNINQQSKAETEILDFIRTTYFGTVETKNRKLLGNGQEIDIYIPEKKIGIEVDGLYWHSDTKKDKEYHLTKTKLAHEKGIRLIHIFNDEWHHHKEIVKTKLKTILGLNNDKNIYARKCTIKEISAKEKNNFLDQYHIQGKDASPIKIGLFYENELVGVMTFCKPRISLGNKNKNNGEYELCRFATKYHITGGFSKLLKHALDMYPEILTIKTFADIRWSDMDNNVYTKNGFTLIGTSKPIHWYFDNSLGEDDQVRIYRYNFAKNKLEKKFPNLYDKNLTEFQIMDKTNYKRVYDCGNLVYELKRQ